MPRGQKAEGGPKGPEVQLSGYQPGTEWSGLHRMGDELYAAFMKAILEDDRTGESLRFPVVGVLEAQVGHIGRPGMDKQPKVDLKFIRIEPVMNADGLDGDPVREVLDLLHRLQRVRVGAYPEDLFDSAEVGETDSPEDPARTDGEVPASGGKPTKRAAKKAAAQLAAAPEFRVEE